MMGLSLGLGLSASTQGGGSSGGGLGPELLTDGDFATDPGPWTLADGDAAMTISGGQLLGPGAGVGDSAYASQTISAQTAGTYRAVFTIVSISAGQVQATLDSNNYQGTARTAPGTYTEDIVAAAGFDEARLFLISGGDAVIDNFSLKKVS